MRERKMGKPYRTPGQKKKFAVKVKNPKTGKPKTVRFGDPNMEIKRDDPGRRKNFRSRHNCKDPGPRTKARYWSCKMWQKGKGVGDMLKDGVDEALPSVTRRTFDAAPYSNISLYHVVRILEGALSQDVVNVGMVSKLVERIVVAVENNLVAVLGRAEGDRVSSMLRRSVRLLAERGLKESIDGCRIRRAANRISGRREA